MRKCHAGAMRSIETGIARFRVGSFGPSRNDNLKRLSKWNSQMAVVLTEEQSMLRDSARGVISDKAPVSHLRQLRDTKDATGFSRDLWKTFAEMGFSGLLVPEDFGGSGLGCVEAGVVMEEIGRTLMPSPFLSTTVLAASALSRGGNE